MRLRALKHPPGASANAGFTLVELAVVIGVIGLLAMTMTSGFESSAMVQKPMRNKRAKRCVRSLCATSACPALTHRRKVTAHENQAGAAVALLAGCLTSHWGWTYPCADSVFAMPFTGVRQVQTWSRLLPAAPTTPTWKGAMA